MNKKTEQDIALIKTVLKNTRISCENLSNFFLSIFSIYLIKILLTKFAAYFVKEPIIYLILDVFYVGAFSLVIFVFYKRISRLQNIDNSFILKIWAMVLFISIIASYIIPNLILYKIGNFYGKYEIYNTVMIICRITLAIIPIIIGVIMTGIFIDNLYIRLCGIVLSTCYIILLYYVTNIAAVKVLEYSNILSLLTFLYLAFMVKKTNFNIM